MGKRSRKRYEAFCQAHVLGLGTIDVESDYLPHVVQCENGGAPSASLQAQAVAARSYLYYKLETTGLIRDGEMDQVYTCPGAPTREHVQSVLQTAGQILTYKGSTLCAFFVAGAKQSPPACRGNIEHDTERYVTINWGVSGTEVRQSPLGLVHPSNHQNRGCLSQWGSRCLATMGWSYLAVLHFYYGADIVLEKASGPCVGDSNRPPVGRVVHIDCEAITGWVQDPDEPEVALRVHGFFGGSTGSSQAIQVVSVSTTPPRCDSDPPCPKAFSIPIPYRLRDGKAHGFQVVALDSRAGVDAMLESKTSVFRCEPPAPFVFPEDGLLRPVQSLDSLNAWQLSLGQDLALMTPSEFSQYVEGPALPESPLWIRLPTSYEHATSYAIVDSGLLRPVAARTLAAWRVSPDSLRTATVEELSLPRGSTFAQTPFVVQKTDGTLFILDTNPVSPVLP